MSKLTITQKIWGQDTEGNDIVLYTLQNTHGMKVEVMNFGGIITKIEVPDREGNIEDVALGFDDLAPYLGSHPAFGATIGRYANRIGNAQFTLKGKAYELEKNADPHHIHGGSRAFHKLLWDSEAIDTEELVGVKMVVQSPAGEAGFPGNVTASAIYTLNNENELSITFKAETDEATPINMTNHSYFNLNGCKENVYNHIITIDADSTTAVDEKLIPTGEILSLDNSPLDLRTPTKIGANISNVGRGYDNNYVLNNYSGELRKIAEVVEPSNGRVLEVSTTQPGVQLYTANYLSGKYVGKKGLAYSDHWGFCLETQHFPDSPNHDNFPSTIVSPEEGYEEKVIYKFGVKE